MFMHRQHRGKTRFFVRPRQNAASVALVAEFTRWHPLSMRQLPGNRFVLDVVLPAGRYGYKFVVDGHWTIDPDQSPLPADSRLCAV